MGERDLGFNFGRQNDVEASYTPLIMTFLREYYDKEPLDMRNRCLQYDFTVGTTTFDLKADTRMEDTHNFFIETWSSKDNKKGWFYNTQLDWVLYLNTQNLTVYMLELRELRDHEEEIKHFRYEEIPQESGNYITCGHLVPVWRIKSWLHIQPVDLKPLRNKETSQ